MDCGDDWTKFTLEVWSWVGVNLELDIIDTIVEVEVGEVLLLVSEDDVCAFTEPIVPSTCGLGAGLEWSIVGLGKFGNKVPDCD